ncbi:MAG: hypothetical protein JRI68_01715 [Deltaproteobacteria bacterium]|nr:hypothetical protein [Deltaproteobacteria bacterium]
MATALEPTTPLLGYNNNIPYKGQVYHVQTEDSGSKHPHVITHLFADGGRVISTTKTSYEHYLGSDNLSEKVRATMRDQHKKMVIALRDGEFDHMVELGEAAATEDDSASVGGSLPPEAISDAAEAPPEGEHHLGPPSEPIELLDRAEVASSSPAPTIPIPEVTAGEANLSPPPTGDSPGTYSFVGSRSSPPPRRASDPSMRAAGPVSRPPRRPIPTVPPQRRIRPSAPAPSDAPPPAIERTAPRRVSRPPASSPVPSDERPTGVYRGGAARHHATVPDPTVAAAHAANVFGERFVTQRTFDEVVAAFLRRQG